MKTIPFSLDKYIPGKTKVVTRNGHDVRILCTDNIKACREDCRVVGIVAGNVLQWAEDGHYYESKVVCKDDLFIQVEQTIRPWKPEEVPVGAVVRSGPNRWLITAIWQGKPFLNGCDQHDSERSPSLQTLTSGYEYSLDVNKPESERVWHHCGVEE